MLLLTTTSHVVRVQAGTAGALDCHVSYMSNNAGTVTPVGVDVAQITGTTATSLIGSPTSGIQFNVKNISIFNASATVTTTVTVTHYDGTNTEVLIYANLAPNEELVLDELGGWTHYDPNGNPYTVGSPLTTLGDILTYSSVPARLPVGSNGQALIADSNKATGNKWAAVTLTNASTSTVSAGYASDTYLAGSAVTMPDDGPVAGTIYHLKFDMVKTAAGTATPILTIRYGTAGTTADSALLTFTFTAGTGVADTGAFEVWLHFRTVGSGTSAVVVATATISHQLAATGLTSQGASGYAQTTTVSSGFNSTPAGSILGASFNGGSSFSGTNTLVEAEAFNLN
jgi:hypothetical protein